MPRLLSMPEHLDNERVQSLIHAYRQVAYSPFCDVYAQLAGNNRNDDVEAHLVDARAGNYQAMQYLWIKFLDKAVDIGIIDSPDVEDFLTAARSEIAGTRIDAGRKLYDYLQGQVDHYKATKLYGRYRSSGAAKAPISVAVGARAPALLKDDPAATGPRFQLAPNAGRETTGPLSGPLRKPATELDPWEEWDALTDTIGASAERLWRDVYLDVDPDQYATYEPGEIEENTHRSHQLMLLWLEASLYRQRSYFNQQGRFVVAGAESIRGCLESKSLR